MENKKDAISYKSEDEKRKEPKMLIDKNAIVGVLFADEEFPYEVQYGKRPEEEFLLFKRSDFESEITKLRAKDSKSLRELESTRNTVTFNELLAKAQLTQLKIAKRLGQAPYVLRELGSRRLNYVKEFNQLSSEQRDKLTQRMSELSMNINDYKSGDFVNALCNAGLLLTK